MKNDFWFQFSIWHNTSGNQEPQITGHGYIFIPRHMIVAGYYSFTLDVRMSVRPSICPSVVSPSICQSVFHFRMITWVNISGFSQNLVCALILWRSGLGFLMGKFRQILTELSARDTPIFWFPEDNFSKCQGILTKLGTCTDIVEIWFGIVNGQISSNLGSYLSEPCPNFCFWTITWVNIKGSQLNLVHALILRRSGLGLLMGKFHQCLIELSARDTIMAGYYSLTFLLPIVYVTVHLYKQIYFLKS